MVVKFTEVARQNNVATRIDGSYEEYFLRDVFVNPEHVVCVREDGSFKSLLNEDKLPAGLDPNHTFSHVTVQHGHSGMSLIVIGDPTTVQTKLQGRELLNG